MREVIFRDEQGYLRRSFVRDEDDDQFAQYGIPAGVPYLDIELDWDEIKQTISNEFVSRGVITHLDLQKSDLLVFAANVLKRQIDSVYRRRASEAKRGINNGYQE